MNSRSVMDFIPQGNLSAIYGSNNGEFHGYVSSFD